MNKGSQLNKEPGDSNEQGVPAEQGVRDLKRTRGPSWTKKSGVSNEQGVPAEQGVRGLK